jgi:hypothetical protein
MLDCSTALAKLIVKGGKRLACRKTPMQLVAAPDRAAVRKSDHDDSIRHRDRDALPVAGGSSFATRWSLQVRRVRIYLSESGSADVTSLAGWQECAACIAPLHLGAQRRFAVLT